MQRKKNCFEINPQMILAFPSVIIVNLGKDKLLSDCYVISHQLCIVCGDGKLVCTGKPMTGFSAISVSSKLYWFSVN